MRSPRWVRHFLLVTVLALLAAACPRGAPSGLVIGYILPESGPLAFLGPPQIEGVRLAVEDINAAGGVLGDDVTLLTGDEGGDPAIVRGSAERLIGEGVHAIVGAAASGMSMQMIEMLFENNIVQCSASNTAPDFTDHPSGGFYFRTAPPDEGQAPILADIVAAEYNSTVILARADDYGRGLAQLTEAALRAVGAQVLEVIIYDPDAATYAAEVQRTADLSPESAIVIGFDEGARVLSGLLEAGFTPQQLFGADGMKSDEMWEMVDPANPNVLDGFRGTAPGAKLEFNQRLSARAGVGDNTIYGGQAYDCTIVIALAAAKANSIDPAVFVGEMINVTRGGTPCESYADCLALIEAGDDIDYVGASGPIEWNDAGDPAFAQYEVWEIFEGGQLRQIDSFDARL